MTYNFTLRSKIQRSYTMIKNVILKVLHIKSHTNANVPGQKGPKTEYANMTPGWVRDLLEEDLYYRDFGFKKPLSGADKMVLRTMLESPEDSKTRTERIRSQASLLRRSFALIAAVAASRH